MTQQSVSALVILLTRLPRSLDGFDYEIPPTLQESVQIGSIVQVSLRNKKVWGYIKDIHPSRYPSLKPILGIADPPRRVEQKDQLLIQWFGEHYGVSLSTASLQWAPFFLQPYKITPRKGTFEVQKGEDQKPMLTCYSHEKDRAALFSEMIRYAQSENGQILILQPTVHDAKHLAESLTKQSHRPLCIHSGLKPSLHRERSIQAAMGNAPIIIGTRLAIFLPLPFLRCIIVDQQERMEYKQYDTNPRYDARDIAQQKGMAEDAKVIFSSVAPRIEEMSWQGFRKITTHKNMECDIANLEEDFRNKNYTFISDELHERIKQTLLNKKNISLIINRTGYSRMVSCTVCHYVFVCEQCNNIPRYSSENASLYCSICDTKKNLPASCPSCNGHEYVFPGLGIEKIMSSLKKSFGHEAQSHIRVETSFSFQQTDHAELGLLAFISADPVVSLTDFRSHERQWQSYAWCIHYGISQGADILIQAINSSHIFIQTLKRLDYKAFVEHELQNRKAGLWPPYARLIKIIPTSSTKKTEFSFDAIRIDLNKLKGESDMPTFTIIPLLKQEKRKQWQELLIKLHTPFSPVAPLPQSLKKYITALTDDCIVDIDPVEI